jgi:pimeloyl-ACP methyl ester carboxylesterase
MTIHVDERAVAERPLDVDYLEAGTCGPLVVLVHSSVAGARQWRRLMEDLKNEFRVRAVNLFGYGKTPSWPGHRPQTLEDQARLVEAAIPAACDEVILVGHSFGGSVAMATAVRMKRRVTKLVLLEAIPFSLLAQAGRFDAFAEAQSLRDTVRHFGSRGEWQKAAEKFADYWNGPGTWANTTPERRAAFALAMKPNYFEWDAVINEETTAEEWSQLLPQATLMVTDPETVRPVREIAEILREACPQWTNREAHRGGHMAPLTHPALINPMVRDFLLEPAWMPALAAF